MLLLLLGSHPTNSVITVLRSASTGCSSPLVLKRYEIPIPTRGNTCLHKTLSLHDWKDVITPLTCDMEGKDQAGVRRKPWSPTMLWASGELCTHATMANYKIKVVCILTTRGHLKGFKSFQNINKYTQTVTY